jgi:hypothetical protein
LFQIQKIKYDVWEIVRAQTREDAIALMDCIELPHEIEPIISSPRFSVYNYIFARYIYGRI